MHTDTRPPGLREPQMVRNWYSFGGASSYCARELRSLRQVAVLLLALTFCAPSDIPAEEDWFSNGRELLADYSAEIRGSDGRLDVQQMIARLTELKVDVYFYLIWHRSTDWEDLATFLPAAREHGIDIWVYLVPPSESPPTTTRYSEPFRLDYLQWAEEIATLSLDHPNLTAFVIDDFYANRAFYTPAYAHRMRDRARSINPGMRFLPLMYYREMGREFVENYRSAIDGVVAAYPTNAQAVQDAWRLLNDRLDEPERWSISYPWQTRSETGYYGSVSRRMQVLQADRHEVLLQERDSYVGPTTAYHLKQLLIDGAVAWQQDVGGGDRLWQKHTIDVSAFLNNKSSVQLTFRVHDEKGVSNFGVDVELQDLSFQGLQPEPGASWQTDRLGPFELDFRPAYRGTGSFHLPLLVMIAANRSAFAKRNGEPASVERMRDKVQMAIAQMREGFAEGVVTYAMKKDVEDEVYLAITQLYQKAVRSVSADFDTDGDVDFEDFVAFARAFGRHIGRANVALSPEPG